ncbi:MAG: MFS transporter, partial [Pseudomonadota bacterium]
LAALAGAAVISWANASGAVSLPGLGDLRPWQLTLIVVGLPGLALVPLVLMLPEPARRRNTAEAAGEAPGFGEVLRYVGARKRLFAGFVSVFCFMILIGYSTSWGAATFARTWGWSAVEYAKAIGVTFLIVGPLTVNFAGWLSDRLYSRGRADAPFLIPLAGVPIMLVGGAAWPLMPTGELGLIVLGVTMAGSALASATGVTALLNIIPAAMRGQVIALYYMTISLFGIGFGPLSVGLLSDFVFGEAGLRYSMAVLPVIFGAPVLLLSPWILRDYRAALRSEGAARDLSPESQAASP